MTWPPQRSVTTNSTGGSSSSIRITSSLQQHARHEAQLMAPPAGRGCACLVMSPPWGRDRRASSGQQFLDVCCDPLRFGPRTVTLQRVAVAADKKLGEV